MVKKIGVVIAIIALVFFGIPQIKVEASDIIIINEYGIPQEIYDAIWNDGYDFGYMEGEDDGLLAGYTNGYNDARAEFGYFDGTNWLGYNDARNEFGIEIPYLDGTKWLGYYEARDNFGYFDGEVWLGYWSGFMDGQNVSLDDYAWFNPDTNTWLGYDDGLQRGLSDGLVTYGYWDGTNWLFYQDGVQVGYQLGINATDATGFDSLLTTIFSGLGGLLSINILPNISIGAIIAVPLVFGIIFFILGKRKGD